mgnify:CR=1 FL=1
MQKFVFYTQNQGTYLNEIIDIKTCKKPNLTKLYKQLYKQLDSDLTNFGYCTLEIFLKENRSFTVPKNNKKQLEIIKIIANNK